MYHKKLGQPKTCRYREVAAWQRWLLWEGALYNDRNALVQGLSIFQTKVRGEEMSRRRIVETPLCSIGAITKIPIFFALQKSSTGNVFCSNKYFWTNFKQEVVTFLLTKRLIKLGTAFRLTSKYERRFIPTVRKL